MASTQASQSTPHHIQSLVTELPNSVIRPSDAAAFKQFVDSAWSQQNREIIPACIVQPRDASELGRAVRILKQEHAIRSQHGTDFPASGFFAVRSGGANSGLGFATVQDGVVIDLGRFNEISPAADRLTVTVGAGVKWGDLYGTLDAKGLTVVGGRNSPVGVGGLTLQGGLSFYSPKYGFVCSNVVSYEVVLADGSVVNASANDHPDLWRVLKGGSSNFGIVTRFTMRSMPSSPIWVGQTFVPAALQRDRAFRTLHEYLNHVSSGQPGTFDESAAGPILSFAHVSSLPFHIMALHLAYTKVAEEQHGGRWPTHWKDSGFASLWKFWGTSDVQSHGSAAEQLARNTPAGTRHVHGTTTIRNDVETMRAAYELFCRATEKLRRVKGLLFPLIYQVILPAWMNKGDPNVFGLDKCTEPLIILNCAVAWDKVEDDELVRSTVANLWTEVDTMAAARKTDHPYRFINYCMEFQRPYDGCGEENKKILREASRKYDPDGLFQHGLAGGLKLGGLLDT